MSEALKEAALAGLRRADHTPLEEYCRWLDENNSPCLAYCLRRGLSLFAYSEQEYEHLCHLFFRGGKTRRENLRIDEGVQELGVKLRSSEVYQDLEDLRGLPKCWWSARLGPIVAHGHEWEVAFEFDGRWLWWESWGPGDGEYSHGNPPWEDR